MSSSSGFFGKFVDIFKSRHGVRNVLVLSAGLAVGASVYLFARRTSAENAATEATQTGGAKNLENENDHIDDEEEEDEDDDEEEEEEEIDEEEDEEEVGNNSKTNIPDAQLGMIIRSPASSSSSTMTRPQVVALVSLFANTVVCYVFAVMAAMQARRELPHFAIPVAWTGVGALVGILVQFFRRRHLRIRSTLPPQQLQAATIVEEEEEEKEEVEKTQSSISSSSAQKHSAKNILLPTPKTSTQAIQSPSSSSTTSTHIKTPIVSSTAPIRRLEFTSSSTSSSTTTATTVPSSTADRLLKFPAGSPASSPPRSRGPGADDDEPQPPSAGGGATQKKGTGGKR